MFHRRRRPPIAPGAASACGALAAGALLAIGAWPGAGAADGGPRSREQLHAVLWMQQASEYRALVAQVYRLATERLATATQPGTAAVEQFGMDPVRLAALPTAVVVDLDETVLDNSYYQARLVLEGREYDEPGWQVWMQEAAATLLPGAREYLDAATRAGHRVFYVTNRRCLPLDSQPLQPCPAKAATRRNLVALGLPGAADPDSLLLRGERAEWSGNDKSVRRAWLGQRFRIVAIAGDDLRDFIDRPVYDGRRAELEPLFGTRWFLLPNAMYGSWERGLAEPACAGVPDPAECGRRVLERKYALLETTPPPLALDGAAGAPWDPRRDRLRIATWNIEYLLDPATYAALAPACVADGGKVPGGERRVPCAIVPRLDRGPEDFAALRRYAALLDADVVALQEADGPGAARQVLPGYEFCFSSRPNVQKNGFAIRRGLPFRCDSEYWPLSLEDRFRRGVVVTLFPETDGAMTLMNVHLKSGCPAGRLGDEGKADCVSLAAQVPPLEAWIDAQAAAGRRFGLLGDFNRRFSAERGPARDQRGALVNLWPEIDDRDPAGADLLDATANQKFVKCVETDPYDAYIDTIVLGSELAPRLVRNSFRRVVYSREDARDRRLSDHCPVAVDLALQ
jgi:5'-nucleotidase (lipoprotein e(P4) family)